MQIDPAKAAAGALKPELTEQQKEALKRLHAAATQFEGIFVDMLFKSMRAASPKASLTGKVSETEKTFAEMLDQKRSEQLAQSGSLGIAKILEAQLREAVLASPDRAAKTRVPREGEL